MTLALKPCTNAWSDQYLVLQAKQLQCGQILPLQHSDLLHFLPTASRP